MNQRAAELRRAFDRSFAHVPTVAAVTVENLLGIRIGPNPFALRLAEVGGLFADKRITGLPSSVPSLLGIAGFRGAILPVYDLRVLLGLARAAAPRWLIVTAGTPIGLAFDQFDGHLRVLPEAIAQKARLEVSERHVREVVQADVVRSIVHVASVLESIRSQVRRDAPQKKE